MHFHLRSALDDFRRTWPQLLVANLLSVAIVIVVATPLLGLLLKLFLLSTEDNVLTDTDIATFFLHPLGLVALVILGAFALAVYLGQVGAFMVIGFGAAEDRRVTYLDALKYMLPRLARFTNLAGRIIGRVLLLVAPFLAGLGGVYLLFLRAHDINYYLATRPPEFRRAVAIAGVLVAACAWLLVRMVASWVLALPVLLFEDAGGGTAMHRSREATAPHRQRIAVFLIGWFIALFLISTAASFVVGALGGLLVPDLRGDLILVLVGLTVTLALTSLTSSTIHFIGGALLPLAVVRWYRELAGPGWLIPSIASPGTLQMQKSWRLPGKAILGAVALAVVVVMGSAYMGTRSLGSDAQASIIAHRGASGSAPENTMAAFELAHEQAADWIELDVQEDADGRVVVAHDSDFMKQARSGLKVWEARQSNLAELDIGGWFDPSFSDQRVMTLREVLTWAKGRLGVVIELKYYGHDEQLEARVVEIVESTGMRDDVMVMSLKRPGLRKIGELRPDWTRGLLNTASLGDLTSVDVDFLALNAAAATRGQIRRAHDAGMAVYVWTINDPVQMSMMLSRGADGIITDEPGLARELLELREKLSPIGHLIVWMAGEAGVLVSPSLGSEAADA